MCGSFLIPGNKVLQAGLYMVKLSDAQHGCVAKDELNISSILMCPLLSNGFSYSLVLIMT